MVFGIAKKREKPLHRVKVLRGPSKNAIRTNHIKDDLRRKSIFLLFGSRILSSGIRNSLLETGPEKDFEKLRNEIARVEENRECFLKLCFMYQHRKCPLSEKSLFQESGTMENTPFQK